MSQTKKIKKEINKTKNTYNDLLCTSYGSFYKTVSMFLPKYEKGTFAFIRMFDKATLPYEDDPEYLQKTCKALGIDIKDIIGLPIAKIQSKWNTLFYPYAMEMKDGKPTDEMVIIPIMENGMLPTTCNKADNIEYIDWKKVCGIVDDKDRKEMEQEMR